MADDGQEGRRQRPDHRSGGGPGLAVRDQEPGVPQDRADHQSAGGADAHRRDQGAVRPAGPALAGPDDLGRQAQRARLPLGPGPGRRCEDRACRTALGAARMLRSDRDHAAIPRAAGAERAGEHRTAASGDRRPPGRGGRGLGAAAGASAQALCGGGDRRQCRALRAGCGGGRAARPRRQRLCQEGGRLAPGQHQRPHAGARDRSP